MVPLLTNPWVDAYSVSAAGEYRHTSLTLLYGTMAEGEDAEELIQGQFYWSQRRHWLELKLGQCKQNCLEAIHGPWRTNPNDAGGPLALPRGWYLWFVSERSPQLLDALPLHLLQTLVFSSGWIRFTFPSLFQGCSSWWQVKDLILNIKTFWS